MNSKYKQFKQGLFKPINPEKCLNSSQIEYRSHLEFRLMKMCDKNPNVIQWSSEQVIIPYKNPVKNKVCRYFVDAYLKLKTPNGFREFLVEIKPQKQTEKPKITKNKKKTTILYENAMYAINQSKWEAAKQFAKSRNMEFIILTENDLDKLEGKV